MIVDAASPQADGDEKPKDIERYWLKIFNDIQTDMRFVTMPYEHQGIYFNLLVLANNPFCVGRIFASREDVARALRIGKQKLDKALDDFETRSLVFIEGNTIQIADERHYTGPGLNPSDARAAKAERMRQWRARTKAAEQERLREEAMRSSHQKRARVDQDSEDQGSEDKGQVRDMNPASRSEVFPQRQEADEIDPPYPLAFDGYEDLMDTYSDGDGGPHKHTDFIDCEEMPLL